MTPRVVRGARGGAAALAAAAGLIAGACAARVPVVTAPAYPDFIYPAPPAGPAASADRRQPDAWAFLQAGDLVEAEARFAALLADDAGFFPARTGLGWVALAQGRPRAAAAHFDDVLLTAADYAPALAGRGDALLAADDVAAALGSFEAAVAADPGLVRIERLVRELRLRVMTDRLAAARAAVDEGRLAAAEAAYAAVIAASPESAFLHVELARLKRRQDDPAAALAAVREARRLDPQDAGAVLLEGELLEAMGDVGAAIEAYRLAAALDPDTEAAARLARVRTARRLAALPDEYRAIGARDQVTRGDLAALLGIGLAGLIGDAGAGAPTPIFTDTRDHWAERWMVDVARAGVMQADVDYRFEPDRTVRRDDLAGIVADALGLVAAVDAAAARSWRGAQITFADLAPGHLRYGSASAAVAAGVLEVGGARRFEPTRPVTGAEAVEAVERLARLAAESP